MRPLLRLPAASGEAPPRVGCRRCPRRLALVCLALVCLAPTFELTAQTCEVRLADFGIRYRFTSGQLRSDPHGITWWRFLTEPYVTELTRPGTTPGLTEGDVVVMVDGHLITTETGSRRFHFAQDGASRFTVRRGEELLELDLVPNYSCAEEADASYDERPTGASARPTTDYRRLWGLGFRCIDCGGRSEAGETVWQFSEPPFVTEVRGGSGAALAGVEVGDRLTAIDGLSISSDEGERRFSRVRPGDRHALTFERTDRSITVELVASPL